MVFYAQINAIGTVTLAKESSVTAARKAYNSLDAKAKKMVSTATVSKLTSAEKKLVTLKKEAEIKKYTPAKVKISKISSAGKTMYFRIRAYRKAVGRTFYGPYSAVKKIKVKR